MSEAELAAIEARWNKATPGPWKNDATMDDDTPVVYVDLTTTVGGASVLFEADWGTEADAEATAHAPTDIRALLADNRRLRAALAFYANKKNWRFYQTSDVPPSMKVTKSAVEIDNGNTARRALAGEEMEDE